ncbi:hypothetical protein [Rhizobium sp.]
MHITDANKGAEIDIKPENMKADLNTTRPDAESESREVPAAYYFYRYF